MLDVRAVGDDRGATSGVESWGRLWTLIVRVDQDIRPLVLSSLSAPSQVVQRDNSIPHIPSKASHPTPSNHVQV